MPSKRYSKTRAIYFVGLAAFESQVSTVDVT